MKKVLFLSLWIASGHVFADDDAAAAAAAAAVANLLDVAELDKTMAICGPIADEAHAIMMSRQTGKSKSGLVDKAQGNPKTLEMIEQAFERYIYEHPRDQDLAAEEFKNAYELECVAQINATH